MKTVKNIVVAGVTYVVLGASVVIGFAAGTTIWENGLQDKVAKVSKKLFKDKEKEA